VRGLADPLSDLGCGPILDRRLRADTGQPLAVAVSGGGDSLALALIARDWARGHGRRLLILTVDHGLRPESRDWTRACADLAARLDADFQALAWEGDKPARGLPAAARQARHRLIAQAARTAGARVVLMGHTASDITEAQAMRAAGSTTPSPREWAPSPAWPQGRGLFILRPLLGIDRAEIRAWLAARGETWIDDPANEDQRFARARARKDVSSTGPAAPPSPDLSALASAMRADRAGVLSLPRAALGGDGARAFIGAACLCAAGTARPPRGDATDRLAARLATGEVFAATLAGARIEADTGEIRFMREPGEAARGGLAALALKAGQTQVWDGRFEATAMRALTLRPLAGLAARLPAAERAALSSLAPSARAGLPAVVEGETARCPIAAPMPGLTLRPLALERLLAACGTVVREP